MGGDLYSGRPWTLAIPLWGRVAAQSSGDLLHHAGLPVFGSATRWKRPNFFPESGLLRILGSVSGDDAPQSSVGSYRLRERSGLSLGVGITEGLRSISGPSRRCRIASPAALDTDSFARCEQTPFGRNCGQEGNPYPPTFRFRSTGPPDRRLAGIRSSRGILIESLKRLSSGSIFAALR